VGAPQASCEPLRAAPVQALSLAQRPLAQAGATPRDPLEQGLARLLAAFARKRRTAGCGQQGG